MKEFSKGVGLDTHKDTISPKKKFHHETRWAASVYAVADWFHRAALAESSVANVNVSPPADSVASRLFPHELVMRYQRKIARSDE